MINIHATVQIHTIIPFIIFSFILRHNETSELQYFHSSSNNALIFQQPYNVPSTDRIDYLADEITIEDIDEAVYNARQNTKWRIEIISNLSGEFIVE